MKLRGDYSAYKRSFSSDIHQIECILTLCIVSFYFNFQLSSSTWTIAHLKLEIKSAVILYFIQLKITRTFSILQSTYFLKEHSKCELPVFSMNKHFWNYFAIIVYQALKLCVFERFLKSIWNGKAVFHVQTHIIQYVFSFFYYNNASSCHESTEKGLFNIFIVSGYANTPREF